MLAVCLLLVACRSSSSTTSGSTKDSQSAFSVADQEGQVPYAQLKVIPSRSRLLVQGMTEEQVFRTLGLYDIALSGNASGPPERNVRAYELRSGYNMNLVFDATSQPARFLALQLKGQGWKKR